MLTAVVPSEQPPRLLTRAHLPLVVGSLALVTLGAVENRAISTLLPTMLAELGAVGMFGLVSAAPLAAYLVSLATAGWWCDGSGPVPTLWAGALAFAVAQLLVGTATTLPQVVLGRLLSGLAEGLLDVGVVVLVARTLDQRLRPQMMALFATAWMLPSLVGPLGVGLVTDAVGWRWVFLGALLLLVPVWLALRPAMRMSRRTAERTAELADAPSRRPLRAVLPWALLAATALLVLNAAASAVASRPWTSAGAVLVAMLALVVSARRLLPAGTFRAACGIGGIVALRAAVAAGFLGIGGFLPLVMTALHGASPTTAGVSLSITGVMWSVGSTSASRWSAHPGRALHLGFSALSVGLAGSTTLVWTTLPIAVGLTGWAVAGVGIGMITATLSVLTLAVADDTTQGTYSAAAQLAASMAGAVFFAAAGAVLALAGRPNRAAFEVISTAAVLIALLGLVGARRALCAVPGAVGARSV